MKSLDGLRGTVVTGYLAREEVRSFILLFNEKTGSRIKVLPLKKASSGRR